MSFFRNVTLYLSLCTDYKLRSTRTSSSVLELGFDFNRKNYRRISFAARLSTSRAERPPVWFSPNIRLRIVFWVWVEKVEKSAHFRFNQLQKIKFIFRIQYGPLFICTAHRSPEHLFKIGKNNIGLFFFCNNNVFSPFIRKLALLLKPFFSFFR